MGRLAGFPFWAIGCLVFGPVVFVLNAPVNGAPWSDEGATICAFAVVVFGLGVIALLGELLVRLGLDGFQRGLVDQSPQVLCGHFRALPKSEAERLTAHYIGKPIRVCGPVGETRIGWVSKQLMFPVAEFGGNLVATSVNSRWTSQLRALSPGEHTCIVGRIVTVGPFGLFLKDARFVKDDRAQQIPRT